MLCAKYNLQSERTFETPCIEKKSLVSLIITMVKVVLLFQPHEDKRVS